MNTWEVIWACSSLLWVRIPCCVMNVLRTPVSVFWGYPKSSISVERKMLLVQNFTPHWCDRKAYRPAVRRWGQSCSWCFLPKLCQSTTACNRWLSGGIQRPSTRWHSVSSQQPPKYSLAAIQLHEIEIVREFHAIDGRTHTLTWKKEVRAMLVTGDLTCCLAWMTFTRKASTAFLPMSSLYTRDIKTSPLWL